VAARRGRGLSLALFAEFLVQTPLRFSPLVEYALPGARNRNTRTGFSGTSHRKAAALFDAAVPIDIDAKPRITKTGSRSVFYGCVIRAGDRVPDIFTHQNNREEKCRTISN
jgi:hypothetical protein